jgi:hypothetical protein
MLVAFKYALALLRRHGVELRQTVTLTLLRLLRKLMEAGFTLQRLLLLSGREVAVLVHPLGEVFTAGSAGGGPWAGASAALLWRHLCGSVRAALLKLVLGGHHAGMLRAGDSRAKTESREKDQCGEAGAG